jgi:hypothetical protein
VKVHVDVQSDAEEVTRLYHHFLKRVIEPRPRSVWRSGALGRRTLSVEATEALAEIEQRSIAGETLVPFLHRRLRKKPAYNDGMLNEWGIHHLHLGSTPRADGHVAGSDEVLCVLVRAEDLYMIDLHPHRDWSNDRLVQIVHDEWPAVIEPYAVRTVQADGITSEQREVLRSKNGMALTRVQDGTCYGAVGGGYAATGTNLGAVRETDALLHKVRAFEADIRANAVACAAEIEKARGTRPSALNYRLVFDEDGELAALETQSRVQIRLQYAV